MKQPYIGNTKINKLYKGNELWCNWVNVDVPSTFETIIFCQSNNNINQNGQWRLSTYNCYTGTKSLFTTENTATITSNLLTLPPGVYRWSLYYYFSETCNFIFTIEGDISRRYEVKPSTLKDLEFNKIDDFEITSTSNITLKLSAKSVNVTGNYCRFFDWKLEKIS